MVTVKVAEPVPPAARGMLVGLSAAVMSGVGAEAVRLTVPLKPCRLVKVMVDMLEEPGRAIRNDGSAPMLKSGMTTSTATVTERTSEPLVPVTVTLYCPGVVVV